MNLMMLGLLFLSAQQTSRVWVRPVSLKAVEICTDRGKKMAFAGFGELRSSTGVTFGVWVIHEPVSGWYWWKTTDPADIRGERAFPCHLTGNGFLCFSDRWHSPSWTLDGQSRGDRHSLEKAILEQANEHTGHRQLLTGTFRWDALGLPKEFVSPAKDMNSVSLVPPNIQEVCKTDQGDWLIRVDSKYLDEAEVIFSNLTGTGGKPPVVKEARVLKWSSDRRVPRQRR